MEKFYNIRNINEENYKERGNYLSREIVDIDSDIINHDVIRLVKEKFNNVNISLDDEKYNELAKVLYKSAYIEKSLSSISNSSISNVSIDYYIGNHILKLESILNNADSCNKLKNILSFENIDNIDAEIFYGGFFENDVDDSYVKNHEDYYSLKDKTKKELLDLVNYFEINKPGELLTFKSLLFKSEKEDGKNFDDLVTRIVNYSITNNSFGSSPTSRVDLILEKIKNSSTYELSFLNLASDNSQDEEKTKFLDWLLAPKTSLNPDVKTREDFQKDINKDLLIFKDAVIKTAKNKVLITTLFVGLGMFVKPDSNEILNLMSHLTLEQNIKGFMLYDHLNHYSKDIFQSVSNIVTQISDNSYFYDLKKNVTEFIQGFYDQYNNFDLLRKFNTKDSVWGQTAMPALIYSAGHIVDKTVNMDLVKEQDNKKLHILSSNLSWFKDNNNKYSMTNLLLNKEFLKIFENNLDKFDKKDNLFLNKAFKNKDGMIKDILYKSDLLFEHKKRNVELGVLYAMATEKEFIKSNLVKYKQIYPELDIDNYDDKMRENLKEKIKRSYNSNLLNIKTTLMETLKGVAISVTIGGIINSASKLGVGIYSLKRDGVKESIKNMFPIKQLWKYISEKFIRTYQICTGTIFTPLSAISQNVSTTFSSYNDNKIYTRNNINEYDPLKRNDIKDMVEKLSNNIIDDLEKDIVSKKERIKNNKMHCKNLKKEYLETGDVTKLDKINEIKLENKEIGIELKRKENILNIISGDFNVFNGADKNREKMKEALVDYFIINFSHLDNLEKEKQIKKYLKTISNFSIDESKLFNYLGKINNRTYGVMHDDHFNSFIDAVMSDKHSLDKNKKVRENYVNEIIEKRTIGIIKFGKGLLNIIDKGNKFIQFIFGDKVYKYLDEKMNVLTMYKNVKDAIKNNYEDVYKSIEGTKFYQYLNSVYDSEIVQNVRKFSSNAFDKLQTFMEMRDNELINEIKKHIEESFINVQLLNRKIYLTEKTKEHLINRNSELCNRVMRCDKDYEILVRNFDKLSGNEKYKFNKNIEEYITHNSAFDKVKKINAYNEFLIKKAELTIFSLLCKDQEYINENKDFIIKFIKDRNVNVNDLITHTNITPELLKNKMDLLEKNLKMKDVLSKNLNYFKNKSEDILQMSSTVDKYNKTI